MIRNRPLKCVRGKFSLKGIERQETANAEHIEALQKEREENDNRTVVAYCLRGNNYEF